MKKHYLSLEPLINWRQEVRPIPWTKVFGRAASIRVEIGFGLGDFLVRQARKHPENDFVGIDLEWPLVRRALRKIALADVKNVRILQADVNIALQRLFTENSLHSAFALFPCPWPKRKHRKKRLFSSGFLKLLNSRLTNDGHALIVTDHQAFSDWIMSQIPGTGFQAETDHVSPGLLTKYEKKWTKQGQTTFYQVRLTKYNHLSCPPREDEALITYRVGHFNPEDFQPKGIQGDMFVKFKTFLYDPQSKTAMVRTIVEEDNLVQDFWIEIIEGGHGWDIRPAKGCSLIPTVGAQKALKLIFESIQGRATWKGL